MSCEWRMKLEGYVDDELPRETSAEYEQHLRQCPECAAAALGQAQLKRAIRAAAVERYAPSPALRSRILQMNTPAAPGWGRAWWPRLSLAAAALALVVVAGAVWLARPRPQEFAGELLDLHVATLASSNPVDVLSSNRHTVKPWFEGRLPFTFSVPDLQGSPFRLIGGRVTYWQQRPGAQLLFGMGQHQISVFLFQDRGQVDAAIVPEAHINGFTIESWRQGGLRCAVVGDTGAANLHALRRLMQAAAVEH